VDLARSFAQRIAIAVPERNFVFIPSAAGCGAHLLALPSLVDETGREAAGRLAESVRDLSQALLAGPKRLNLQDVPPVRVVYQDACHLRHAQGVFEPPRELLRRAGAILIDLEEADLCCGSAGTYNLGQAEMGERLGRRKARAVSRTGAEVVVTSNPGCAIQMSAYLPRRGPRVVTLARFLAERLAPAACAETSRGG
jgi:glycolate oxidase iron-sulfur subunit